MTGLSSPTKPGTLSGTDVCFGFMRVLATPRTPLHNKTHHPPQSWEQNKLARLPLMHKLTTSRRVCASSRAAKPPLSCWRLLGRKPWWRYWSSLPVLWPNAHNRATCRPGQWSGQGSCYFFCDEGHLIVRSKCKAIKRGIACDTYWLYTQQCSERVHRQHGGVHSQGRCAAVKGAWTQRFLVR